MHADDRFDERQRWAQPELTQGIGIVNTRTANGGRAMPRTSQSYRMPDGTRNPVVVRNGDDVTIVAGSSFNRASKAARIAKLTGKTHYAAATKAPAAPAAARDYHHRVSSKDLPAIGEQYD